MIRHKNKHPVGFVIKSLPLAVALICVGCTTTIQTPEKVSTDRTMTTPKVRQAIEQPAAHLIALLPMRNGYDANDHDTYETRLSPMMKEHGMALDSVFTVSKYLGGNGPSGASSLGIWSLGTDKSLGEVMGDSRYQAQTKYRDTIHDMANTPMYMVKEEFKGAPLPSGHVLLVGLLVMNQGFDFNAHDAYEKAIAPITARYGMHIYRSYRVLQKMGEHNADNVVAVNLWELPNPEALGKIMSDPDYLANIPNRDKIHNMKATTMYFATPRSVAQ